MKSENNNFFYENKQFLYLRFVFSFFFIRYLHFKAFKTLIYTIEHKMNLLKTYFLNNII